MNPAKPGLPLARTERLCDYELPDDRPPARPPLFPPLTGNENWSLTWWLWMEDMGNYMAHRYDRWRDQVLHTLARKPNDA